MDKMVRSVLHDAVDRVVDGVVAAAGEVLKRVAQLADEVMENQAPTPKPPVTKMCKHCGLALPEDAE